MRIPRFPLLARPEYLRWIARQDHGALEQIGSDRLGGQLAIAAGVLIALCTQVPGADAFFRLRPLPVALCFIPLALCAIVQRGLAARRRDDPFRWAVVLASTFALQFQSGAFVAYSEPPGVWMFVAFLVITAALQGFVLRASRDAWFVPAGTALVMILLAVLAATQEARLLLLALVPAVLVIEVTAGTFALRQYEDRIERDQLRAAVNAQLLEAQSARSAHLEGALVDVLGRSHDLNNTVMGALLATEDLVEQSRHGSLGPEVVVPLARSIRSALVQIRDLSHEMRNEGRGAVQREADVVDARRVCEEALGNARQMHPTQRLTSDMPPGPQNVLVGGGIASLRSVVDNLLLNACQGDGKRRAECVAVSLKRDDSGALIHLVVEDDGPGFPSPQLAAPITPFLTTKRAGSGLGLYTTERLVGASGGALIRSNRADGGARVELTLRTAFVAPDRIPDDP